MDKVKRSGSILTKAFLLVLALPLILLLLGIGGAGVGPSVEKKNSITIVAKNFSFSEDVIRVKRGEELTLNVVNLDGLHGLIIRDLDVYIINGDHATFTPTEPGEYEFVCGNPHCGEGHHLMTGTLIVE